MLLVACDDVETGEIDFALAVDAVAISSVVLPHFMGVSSGLFETFVKLLQFA